MHWQSGISGPWRGVDVNKKPRAKKCRACGEKFIPRNTLQVACSPKCALEEGRKKMEKQNRKELKQLREKIKTRGEWLKEAQAAFNRWVREMDYDKPCISCGKPAGTEKHLTGSGWDAGHYRSIGSAPHLRFERKNCHKQCVKCNQYLSGNVVEYRKGLIERIGLEEVEKLEAYQEPRKYTIENLKNIKASFNKLANELKKQREEAEATA